MIHYLKQQEKERSRFLWEDAFNEDSKSFTDYYFQEKLKDNRILVKEIDGDIVSVLHQNPYSMMFGNVQWNVDYIVGVATDKSNRKQGHMRTLFSYMLGEMYAEEMPFCFLMPENENIYLTSGFAYIFDQPLWRLRVDAKAEKRQVFPGYIEDVIRKEMSLWLNGWLSQNYQVYCIRNENYLKCLELEIKSEEGNLFLLYQDGQICGMQSFWGALAKEQRFLLCEETLREDAVEEKPAIMARIVNLGTFMKQIHLKKDSVKNFINIYIRIEDNQISANDGVFCWTLNQYGSVINRAEGQVQLTLSIGQLTQWLFGYRKLESLLGWLCEIPDECFMIQVLDGVYLDEVV